MAVTTTYHKEELRADLLRVGHAYVAASGHEGLSVRKLAAHAGVSPGAPYHHFPDKRTFLLAMAKEGFDELWERGSAIRAQAGSPIEVLTELAYAFFAFQAEKPRLVDQMYESELTRPIIDPLIVTEQLRAYGLLRGAIEDAIPGMADGEARARTVAFWSAIYGYASLVGKGLLQPLASDGETSFQTWRDALVRQTVAAAILENTSDFKR